MRSLVLPMRYILLFILLFSQSKSRAHSDELFSITKKGITLFCRVTEGSKEERLIYRAFLDQLTKRLVRADRSIPVYIWMDQFPLLFYRRDDWFATIGFDSLQIPDLTFLNDYFEYRMGAESRAWVEKRNLVSEKYKTALMEPIDLGSTYDLNPKPVGLKVFYDYGFTDSTTGWDRVYSLVQYAIDHIDAIKLTQKRIALQYPNGIIEDTRRVPMVSILTIDTNLIKQIPLRPSGFDHKKVNTSNNRIAYILGFSLLILIVVLLLFRIRTRH